MNVSYANATLSAHTEQRVKVIKEVKVNRVVNKNLLLLVFRIPFLSMMASSLLWRGEHMRKITSLVEYGHKKMLHLKGLLYKA